MAFAAPLVAPLLLGGAVTAGASVVGKLLAPKSQASSAPQQAVNLAPTRDAAAELARREDLRRRRTGGAGNAYAGDTAAATPAAKTLLGPGG